VRDCSCCNWCCEGSSKGLVLINGERSHQLSRSGSEWSGLVRQATFSTAIVREFSRLFELLLVRMLALVSNLLKVIELSCHSCQESAIP
jgi:hypothetical protein